MRYALIGAGVAGIAAAQAIRGLDGNGEIVFLSDDPHGYYSRPGLAYYLTGELAEQNLFPLSDEKRKALRARFVHGRVSRIQPELHSLDVEGQGSLSYDRLLIATGSAAIPPAIPGRDLQGVVKLDHLEDARRILALARRARSAVVVGGGITALELVEGLRARRVQVHYLLRGDRYWSNVLDEHESRWIERLLADQGVRIHYNTEAVEVLGRRGHVTGVRTGDGQIIACQLAAFAIGIRPRLELAAASGLRTERGILADEHMETSAPDVFAAGDVAQVHDPASGRSVLDSLWNPARAQGYIAGLNMAGKPEPYRRSVTFNVTRLAGLTTTIIGAVGHARGEDALSISRGESESWRYLPDAIIAQSQVADSRLRLLVGPDRLLGAVVMGEQTLSLPLQDLVSQQVDITPMRERLLQPGALIGRLVLEFWLSWKDAHAAQ